MLSHSMEIGVMSYQMFIDDERYPIEQDKNRYIIARSSDQAITIMKSKGCPSYISFDHDLGDEDKAMIVVKWIIEKDLDEPGFIPNDFDYYVHSQNPIGKANIDGLLKAYLNQRSN